MIRSGSWKGSRVDRLSAEEEAGWLAYMRVMLRLSYEMNRELQDGYGLSLGDFDVLLALAGAPGGRLQTTELAAVIGWERSRVSHHLQRMAGRGLTERRASDRDRRATDVVLTGAGRAALDAAAPGHVALVRRLFFDGLDRDLLTPLRTALEQVYAHLLDHGVLPRPPAL
jgi:DNA-binding MarR family transcriptional regulator